jgi:hypothetical protein
MCLVNRCLVTSVYITILFFETPFYLQSVHIHPAKVIRVMSLVRAGGIILISKLHNKYNTKYKLHNYITETTFAHEIWWTDH